MAKKEITVQFKLQAPGGTATPAPPIGPALGQHGVNPGQFIQQFNAATAALKGKVVGVVVTVYKDRTFSFEVKSPPASVLLKDAVKAEKGSGVPNKEKIGKLTMAQCKELAKEKIKDLNAFDLDAAAKVLAGTARSMGITEEGKKNSTAVPGALKQWEFSGAFYPNQHRRYHSIQALQGRRPEASRKAAAHRPG